MHNCAPQEDIFRTEQLPQTAMPSARGNICLLKQQRIFIFVLGIHSVWGLDSQRCSAAPAVGNRRLVDMKVSPKYKVGEEGQPNRAAVR